jgi:hypothetical protein
VNYNTGLYSAVLLFDGAGAVVWCCGAARGAAVYVMVIVRIRRDVYRLIIMTLGRTKKRERKKQDFLEHTLPNRVLYK